MAETLKIKDLPLESRPREAFMRSANPAKDLPDATLLAIPLEDHVVIGCGTKCHVSIRGLGCLKF